MSEDTSNPTKYYLYTLNKLQFLWMHMGATVHYQEIIVCVEKVLAVTSQGHRSVSYTHLDVYKRQVLPCAVTVLTLLSKNHTDTCSCTIFQLVF